LSRRSAAANSKRLQALQKEMAALATEVAPQRQRLESEIDGAKQAAESLGRQLKAAEAAGDLALAEKIRYVSLPQVNQQIMSLELRRRSAVEVQVPTGLESDIDVAAETAQQRQPPAPALSQVAGKSLKAEEIVLKTTNGEAESSPSSHRSSPRRTEESPPRRVRGKGLATEHWAIAEDSPKEKLPEEVQEVPTEPALAHSAAADEFIHGLARETIGFERMLEVAKGGLPPANNRSKTSKERLPASGSHSRGWLGRARRAATVVAGPNALAAASSTMSQTMRSTARVTFSDTGFKEMAVLRSSTRHDAVPEAHAISAQVAKQSRAPLARPMSRAEVTEKKSEATPKEDVRDEFTIVVDKIYGPELGIDAHVGDPICIPIQAVNSGLISNWNLSNPHREVQRGDRIVEVNGIRGSKKMIEEIKGGQILKIHLSRKESAAASRVATSKQASPAPAQPKAKPRRAGLKAAGAASADVKGPGQDDQPKSQAVVQGTGSPSTHGDALDIFAALKKESRERRPLLDVESAVPTAPQAAEGAEPTARGRRVEKGNAVEKARELKRVMQDQNKAVYAAYSHVFDQLLKTEQPKLSQYTVAPVVLQKSASQQASVATLARKAGSRKQAIGKSSLVRAGGNSITKSSPALMAH